MLAMTGMMLWLRVNAATWKTARVLWLRVHAATLKRLNRQVKDPVEALYKGGGVFEWNAFHE